MRELIQRTTRVIKMAKENRKYLSLDILAASILLSLNLKEKWKEKLKNFLNDRTGNTLPPYGPCELTLAGTFYPLFRIAKDVVDTVKPYKGFYQIKRELQSPFTALKLILISLLSVIGVVVHFFYSLYQLGINNKYFDQCGEYKDKSDDEGKGQFVIWIFQTNGSWFLNALLNLFRGLLMLVTTPCVWLLKIPCRALATLFNKGMLKIENNRGIKKALKQKENNETDPNLSKYLQNKNLADTIHAKFLKAINLNQETDIDQTKEYCLYTEFRNTANRLNLNSVSTEDSMEFNQVLENYLALFSSN